MKVFAAVAAALCTTLALVFLAGVLIVPRDTVAGSSAKRTVYSWVHALRQDNLGRACSYMADDVRGPGQTCSNGFLLNVGMGMLFGGVDAFAGIRVKPGSEQCSDDNHCVYTIDDPTGVIGATDVTVVKQDSGRWRIERIG